MSAPVTILIPTHNRARALEAVWPSYLGNPLVARIVVVNDGSTDDTSAVVRRLAAGSDTPVTLVEHPTKQGQQAARLSAIAAAETPWVLFGEDDVWLAEDYLATLYSQAHELDAAVIAGRILPFRVPGAFDPAELRDTVTTTHPPEQLFDLAMMDADFCRRVPRPIPAPYLHTIALIRRDLFDRVRFDTWYAGNGWREETDFYLGVNATGARVVFTPDVLCYHLRGPICASGGQRMNRLALEYYAWRNTWYLVAKHWAYLRTAQGFRGTVTGWMLRFYARRQLANVRRVMRSGFRTAFDA